MGSTLFRNPRALSSALATLGSPQPWALGFLNSVDPLVSASNYYVGRQNIIHVIKWTRPSPSIFAYCMQAIKTWTVGRPRNEATSHTETPKCSQSHLSIDRLTLTSTHCKDELGSCEVSPPPTQHSTHLPFLLSFLFVRG